MTGAEPENWPRIVIVGAGISGICAGIRLDKAGFHDLIILEKMESIGGTWRDNTYPGATCDVPSHLYSFSFAPKDDWSRIYATQSEILSYLEECVARFGVSGSIRYGAEVLAVRYDDSQYCWRIDLADRNWILADVVIMACGQLHRPQIPDVLGQECFAGERIHSALWRSDCDLAGQKVALVGSAASAVQIASAIASEVRQLTIFQRTPNWIAPCFDRRYSKFEKTLMQRVPLLRCLHRNTLYLLQESLIFAFRPNSLVARLLTFAIKRFMRRKIRDEKLAEALMPDYVLGCKRILLSNDYLKLFRRDNVSLVTQEISHFIRRGIVTNDGATHDADIVVYATGFAATEFLAPIEIFGQQCKTLAESWKGGARAYLGMTVPKFPNFFILYGPNSALGHNSTVFMIERQVEYIVTLLRVMRKNAVVEATVREDVLQRYNDRLQARMAKRSWAGSCRSWYRHESGRVVGIWPYSTIRYWWMTRRPKLADYLTRYTKGPDH